MKRSRTTSQRKQKKQNKKVRLSAEMRMHTAKLIFKFCTEQGYVDGTLNIQEMEKFETISHEVICYITKKAKEFPK